MVTYLFPGWVNAGGYLQLNATEQIHYTNSNVPSTTNALEGFHSRLKADYQRHRGLTKEHRVQWIIKWK